MSVTLHEVIQAWQLGDAQQTLDLALQYMEIAPNQTAKSRALHAKALALTKMERYEEARPVWDDLVNGVDQQYQGHIWLPPVIYVFRDERIRVCHLMNDMEARNRFYIELHDLVGEELREHAEEFGKLHTDLTAGNANFDSLI